MNAHPHKRCISWSLGARPSPLHSPAQPPSLPSPLFFQLHLCSPLLFSSYSLAVPLFCMAMANWHVCAPTFHHHSLQACKRKGGDEIVAMMLARLTQRPRGGVMPARSLVLLIEPCQYLSTLSYVDSVALSTIWVPFLLLHLRSC